MNSPVLKAMFKQIEMLIILIWLSHMTSLYQITLRYPIKIYKHISKIFKRILVIFTVRPLFPDLQILQSMTSVLIKLIPFCWHAWSCEGSVSQSSGFFLLRVPGTWLREKSFAVLRSHGFLIMVSRAEELSAWVFSKSDLESLFRWRDEELQNSQCKAYNICFRAERVCLWLSSGQGLSSI